jgi:hypothetical protein
MLYCIVKKLVTGRTAVYLFAQICTGSFYASSFHKMDYLLVVLVVLLEES